MGPDTIGLYYPNHKTIGNNSRLNPLSHKKMINLQHPKQRNRMNFISEIKLSMRLARDQDVSWSVRVFYGPLGSNLTKILQPPEKFELNLANFSLGVSNSRDCSRGTSTTYILC